MIYSYLHGYIIQLYIHPLFSTTVMMIWELNDLVGPAREQLGLQYQLS